MMLRFNKRKGEDPDYTQEWLRRFQTGEPENWMDKTSLAVYKIIKNACQEGELKKWIPKEIEE